MDLTGDGDEVACRGTVGGVVEENLGLRVRWGCECGELAGGRILSLGTGCGEASQRWRWGLTASGTLKVGFPLNI
jgi:hypothetical protein